MKNTGVILFLYAESPLHAGSGSGLGAVDLPIQRERMSNLPIIQGSGVKGALRQLVERDESSDESLALFGPRPPRAGEGSAPNEHAGALSLVDARLLLFPVRTVWGGWAWITSPMVLQRLARDLEILGHPCPEITSAAGALAAEDDDGDPDERGLVSTQSAVARDGHVLIEDLDYRATEHEAVDDLAKWLSTHALPETDAYAPFAARMSGQLVVVSDAELRFLAEYATEVVARTRIAQDTGTVAPGALWTEECLPAETLLWSTALIGNSRRAKKGEEREGRERPSTAADLKRYLIGQTRDLDRHRICLGGDRTVGRGLVGLRVFDASQDEPDGNAAAGKGART